MKIGITETGDPGRIQSWVKNLRSRANIIITKDLRSSEFKQNLMDNKHRIILHATITGHGGTWIEPGSPTMDESFDELTNLISMGFPKDHVVIRVDPILPTDYGVVQAGRVLDRASELGFKRIRWSIMDCYNHVRYRLNKVNTDESKQLLTQYPGTSFHASPDAVNSVVDMINTYASYHPHLSFESCGESKHLALKLDNGNNHIVGCISKFDMSILGISEDVLKGSSGQRSLCLCPGNKIQIMGIRPGRCESKCIYCYWRS